MPIPSFSVRGFALPTLAFVALMFLPHRAAAQTSTYIEIVDRYIDDPDGAIRAMNRSTQPAVRNAVREFEGTKMTSQQAEAAVMLHTDLALALVPDQAVLADFHLRLARQLVQRLAGREPLEFRWRWFSVLVTVQWTLGRITLANETARDASSAMPTVSRFHVLLGALAEARAALVDANLRGADPINTNHSNRAVEGGLRAAVFEYRDALKLDPHDADAHLRIGWVYYLQRHDVDARAELGVARQAAQTSAQRYLALLFRGALDERAAQLDEAARDYDGAIAECPTCQSAYVGRVRVATNAGDTSTARRWAAAYAALPKADASDPWWDVHIGGVDRDSIVWLHDEVHK